MADEELDAMEKPKTEGKSLSPNDLPKPKTDNTLPRKMTTARAMSSAKEAEGAIDRVRASRGIAAPADSAFSAARDAEAAGRGAGDLVIDAAGNATHDGVKVPGNFAKLLDIFGELGSKAKEAVGGAVEGAKGLLSATKTVPTGNAAMGRGAPAAVRQGAMRLGAERAIGLSGPAAAFLEVMKPSSLNEGEVDPGYQDQRLIGTNDGTGDDLMGQTDVAMDKGINPNAKPTMTPQGATPDPRPKTDLGNAMPKAATMTDNVTGKTGQNTAGGFYPTFDKGSSEAADFRTAFANARNAGLNEFQWQGRAYNTKLADASPSSTHKV